MTRRRGARSLQTAAVGRVPALALAALLASTAAGQSADSFRDVLEGAGLTGEQFDQLAAAADDLSDEQAATLGKILFRLDQFERGRIRGLDQQPIELEHIPGDPATLAPGTLIRVAGTASSARRIASAAADATPYWQCDVNLAGGGALDVLSANVPQGWSSRAVLREPVKLLGVVMGMTGDGELRRLRVLANRLEWYPIEGVPTGVAWLAAQGFDAALLDAVRPVSPFARPGESREGQAFYDCLAAVRRGNRSKLVQLARDEVAASVERWTSEAAAAAAEHKELAAQLADASPGDREPLAKRINALRRRQAVAAAVEQRAARGASSVGPLFVTPAETIGALVLLEGTARRAVRIVVDGETAPPGLRDYYELDLFTTDSQDLPVICCVTTLPANFPVGDRINEPVQVAGVFLKRWTYARRTGGNDEPPRVAQRMAAPLVIAAEPRRLRLETNDAAPARSFWIGAAFVAVLAAVWVVVAAATRRDQLARKSRTGYDARLGPNAESRDGAER